jgi:rod shape-determining protein MreC
VFFSSANEVAGSIYRIKNQVTSYLSLKEINDSLIDVNIQLQMELEELRQCKHDIQAEAVDMRLLYEKKSSLYTLIPAHVINNSIRKINNFITLDKGKIDGVCPEMGVINGDGVVGIVNEVSDHYSTVLSLLNTKSITSCKLKGANYFGYLTWKKRDARYATLFDLPSHAKINIGDTIVTSGYSAVYPSGIIVGTVHHINYSDDELSYILEIALSTNMSNLSQVRIITNNEKEKIQKLKN